MTKKSIIRISVSFYVVFFICSTLFAARPLSTDDAGTVEQGKYELEFGYNACKKTDEPKEQTCELSFKHGITEKMDFGLSVPYRIEPQLTERLGSCSVSVKFQILKDIFSFTANNELGSKAYSINTIFSYEFDFITLHFNLGYNATGDEETEGTVSYSTAFEKTFGKIDIVGEVLGDRVGFQDYLFGLRYNLFNSLAVDIGYGNNFRELNEKLTSGLHFEF